MIRKYCVLSILLLFLPGCTTAPEERAGEGKYPQSRYLTAKGIGQSESEARNQAIAEMSRIFESRVYGDTMDRMKAVVDRSGSEISEQSIESTVRIVTDIELRGVQVDDTWFDEKTSMFYAVAVLDRYQARDDWLNEIRNLDSSIEGQFSVFDDAGSRLEKYLSLKKILRLWIERETIVSHLRVLGFDQRAPSSYDIQSVFRGLPGVKTGMKIVIDIRGEHADMLHNSLAEILGKSGFVIGSVRDEADVLIVGTVTVKPVDLRSEGWEFARATASLSIIDAKTGLKVGEAAANKRSGHLTYDEAAKKAVKNVSVPVSEDVMTALEE